MGAVPGRGVGDRRGRVGSERRPGQDGPAPAALPDCRAGTDARFPHNSMKGNMCPGPAGRKPNEHTQLTVIRPHTIPRMVPCSPPPSLARPHARHAQSSTGTHSLTHSSTDTLSRLTLHDTLQPPDSVAHSPHSPHSGAPQVAIGTRWPGSTRGSG